MIVYTRVDHSAIGRDWLRDASNTNVLAKDWDVNTEEKEAEFRDDLCEAFGIGRRKKKVCLLFFIHWTTYYDISRRMAFS